MDETPYPNGVFLVKRRLQKEDVIERFDGRYSFLSNFYLCDILWEGQVWPSSEHIYQACKTLERSQRELIRQLPTPGAAKKYGKRVKIRGDWERVRLDVMRDVIAHKFPFSAKSPLTQLLVGTHPARLIEGNYWNDQFWGVCAGSGLNWLGKILMERREWLIKHGVVTSASSKALTERARPIKQSD